MYWEGNDYKARVMNVTYKFCFFHNSSPYSITSNSAEATERARKEIMGDTNKTIQPIRKKIKTIPTPQKNKEVLPGRGIIISFLIQELLLGLSPNARDRFFCGKKYLWNRLDSYAIV